MQIFRDVRSLNLPDWYLGSGVIRNTVWDSLHGYTKHTKLNDIDVVFYNKNITEQNDKLYSSKLESLNPDYEFEVVNQAYIHKIYPHRNPYLSSFDAISYWTENVTCIGVRLEPDNSFTITDPNGDALKSIFEMDVKPNLKDPINIIKYKERMIKKDWKSTWPMLRISL